MFYKSLIFTALLVFCFGAVTPSAAERAKNYKAHLKMPFKWAKPGNPSVKSKYKISGYLENMVIGPVIYVQHYKNKWDVQLILHKKTRNGSWQPVKELDMPHLKSIYEKKSDTEKRKKLEKGYFEFENLVAGNYRISFKSRTINIFGWRTKLLFDNSEKFVQITDKPVENIRFQLSLSGAGKFFYYSLVCLGFMIFFIGTSLVVIQRVAFRDLKFLSSFGMATVFLTWSVVLVKIPNKTSLPVFLVQAVIFLMIYLKKDYSDLPLPFLTKSFIESKDDYLYNPAVAVTDITDTSAANLRFQDKWHNLVTLRGICFKGEQPIKADTEVHLIEYDRQRDLFYVQSSDQVTGAA